MGENEAGGKPKSFCLPSSTHLLLLEKVYRYARALNFYDIQPVPRLECVDESMAQFSEIFHGAILVRLGSELEGPKVYLQVLYLFILNDPSLL